MNGDLDCGYTRWKHITLCFTGIGLFNFTLSYEAMTFEATKKVQRCYAIKLTLRDLLV